MSPKISVVVLTYRRDDALPGTLSRLADALRDVDHEVILVDNNADGVDRSPMLDAFPRKRLVSDGANLGVAAGRNRGMSLAEGDIVLFLDDDALLDVADDFAARLLAAFEARRDLAVVAFRSFMRDQSVEDPIEFPHTDKTLDRARPFETFRYIGVAHAIRRSMLVEVGPYCECFFYGMEEMDLSYRFLKRGWAIEYRPEFRVVHMKSDNGRLPSKAVRRRMYANKLAVAWMHLPSSYFACTACVWFLKTLLDSRSLVTPLAAIGDFVGNVADGTLLGRNPAWSLVSRVKALGGQPWK